MYWLLVALTVVMVLYFLSKGKSQPSKSENKSQSSKRSSKKRTESIRKGFQIFVPTNSIEGIQFRKDAAIQFIEGNSQQLKLEVEPNNEADKNAIKVIGVCSRGQFHLGYVARDIALKLATTQTLPFVYARLMRTFRSEQNFIDISYQIVGQKDKKELFDSYELNLPITSSQKSYLKFWKIKYEEDITTSNASKLISEHYKNAENNEPNKWLEWQRMEAITDIYDYFSDKDEREQFDIKKPTKKQIEATVDALLVEGLKLDAIQEDYQIFVDKLTELHPQIES